MIDTAVSNTGRVMCLRTRMASPATARPTATPPAAVTTKPIAASPTPTAPAIPAIARRRQVIAVASLTKDSPSRIVTSRRGNPTRRAIDVAATASGGATTAPRANATANGTCKISQVTSPTPSAVMITRSTER